MLSLLEQARAREPGRSDADYVIAIADDLIADWMLEPPISLDVLAGVQGIDRIERVPLEQAACLVPTPGAAVIKLRETDASTRQNFSGFHEIGHTFMPGYQLQLQFRCDPRPGLTQADVEGLCDLAAAEMLLPRRHFARDMEDADWSFEAVDGLAARYAASREATGRRMATLAGSDTFFLKLELRNKIHEPAGSPPRLRAASATPMGPGRPIIPRLKSLDDGDPLQAVLQDGTFDGITALSGLVSDGRRFYVSAVHNAWTDPVSGATCDRALALVRPVARPKVRRA